MRSRPTELVVSPRWYRRLVSDEKPPTPERLPSLDLVAQIVVSEREIQERRTDSLDARAGVVLAFASALVVLHADAPRWILALQILSASSAAIFALRALIPRRAPGWDLQSLKQYASRPADETRQTLIATQIHRADEHEAFLDDKKDHLKSAVRVVVVAVAFAGLANITATKEKTSWPTTPSSPTTALPTKGTTIPTRTPSRSTSR